MTADVKTEHVLVVESSVFQHLADVVVPATYLPLPNVIDQLFTTSSLSFLPRDSAEVNVAVRQIIPYIVVMNRGHLLSYRRGVKGSESRLHGWRSIGWGGHIDRSDVKLCGQELDVLSTIRACATRELDEELGLREPSDRYYLGLIVERASEVGRVHVAFVEVWVVEDSRVARLEDKSEDVLWLTLAHVQAERRELESWSARALGLLEAHTNGAS